MIWLPRTTDISTYFAQSLEIRGIESRLYFVEIVFVVSGMAQVKIKLTSCHHKMRPCLGR